MIIKNNGNFMVENLLKVLKLSNKINTLTGVTSLKATRKIESLTAQRGVILSKLGLYPLSDKHAVAIIESILDNGIYDSTPRECLDYLTALRDLELPADSNKKAVNDLGLTYTLQEANDITEDVSNPKYFNIISDKLNYLDLVDGDYLGYEDHDAIYFNKSKKMATVHDVYKEFNNAINYLKNQLVPCIDRHNTLEQAKQYQRVTINK